MTIKTKLNTAYEDVEKHFPFKNYISNVVYNEMLSILKPLHNIHPIFSGLKLLDIGSGPTDKTAIFQKLGFSCTAIDDLNDPWHLRNNNIQKITTFAKECGIYFIHQKQDHDLLKIKHGYYDIVTILGVIEHLHNSPREILNSIGTYLKPEGHVIIVVPNSVSMRKRISVLLGKSNYPRIDTCYYSPDTYRGHVREYTLSEVKYIVQKSGFKVNYASHFEHYAQSMLSSPIKEAYLMVTTLVAGLSSSICVIAQKPADWKLVEQDASAYQNAISDFVPKGVS